MWIFRMIPTGKLLAAGLQLPLLRDCSTPEMPRIAGNFQPAFLGAAEAPYGFNRAPVAAQRRNRELRDASSLPQAGFVSGSGNLSCFT
jgi:hypothetical protein